MFKISQIVLVVLAAAAFAVTMIGCGGSDSSPQQCDDGMKWSDSLQKCAKDCGDGAVWDIDASDCRPVCPEGQEYKYSPYSACVPVCTSGSELIGGKCLDTKAYRDMQKRYNKKNWVITVCTATGPSPQSWGCDGAVESQEGVLTEITCNGQKEAESNYMQATGNFSCDIRFLKRPADQTMGVSGIGDDFKYFTFLSPTHAEPCTIDEVNGKEVATCDHTWTLDFDGVTMKTFLTIPPTTETAEMTFATQYTLME